MTKNKQTIDSNEYIFIRLDKKLKKRLKEQAKLEGSNMTIWVRQLIIKTIGYIENENS